jgi:hypothetical protein
MGQIFTRDIVLETSSTGSLDGMAFADGFKFSHPITGTLQNLAPYGGVASQTSVLLAVAGVFSTGGTIYDNPWSAAGPAAGTTFSVTITAPSISSGQLVTSTWTKL